MKCPFCSQEVETTRGFDSPVLIRHKTAGGEVCLPGWGLTVEKAELVQLRREVEELRAKVAQLEAERVYQIQMPLLKGDLS